MTGFYMRASLALNGLTFIIRTGWWNWQTGELCYSVTISNDLIQMFNFTTWIPDCKHWLRISQSCSFGFISFFSRQHLFYNGFPFIRKFWLCCFLSFHWLSVKLKRGCPLNSIACVHVRIRVGGGGVRNVRFSENLACFVFLKHPL